MEKLARMPKALLIMSVVACVGATSAQPVFASPAPRTTIASHFKHDAEGWTVVGDPVSPEPEFIQKGGDPGGFIRTTDAALGGIMYWDAPDKFLGDQSLMYGGFIRFDLREAATGGAFKASNVILKGGGFRLTYNKGKDPTAKWKKFKVSLTEKGWLNKGQPATRAEMLTVLADLHTLLIRAEFASHTDVDDLDNVLLKGPKSAA